MHFAFCIIIFADVAELADALVSGSSEAIHVGSSPVVRTNDRDFSRSFFICADFRAQNPLSEAEKASILNFAFAEEETSPFCICKCHSHFKSGKVNFMRSPFYALCERRSTVPSSAPCENTPDFSGVFLRGMGDGA